MIYIRSNDKTIKIEVDDPSVKVLIDEEVVTISGAGDTIKLNVGMHDLVVERGDTKVITRKFEVFKGKNPVLRITLDDANVAGDQNPNAPGRQPPSKDVKSLADLMKQIPGLVAYYPLDENSGAVAKDASGNGHFGKIRGNVEFTSGKVDNAMKFDKEALVDLGKPIDVSRSTPFSIGAWIQPNETGRMSIVSRHPSTRELPGHGLLLARGGTLYGRLSHVWGKNAIQVATKEPLDLTRWHHVMMTYDGSSKAAGLNLFVDGKQQPVNILMDSLTGSIATDSPITISRNVNDLPAGIDEVAIFNRVLRADEVAQIVTWASDTTKTIASASSGGAGGETVVVCDMLQSKRAPAGLNAQAVAFAAPNGDGRRGANGVLIDAPAGWETQGTVWSCDFARDGASRGVIFIHPHRGGQVMVTVSAAGLHVGSPGEWPNDRNASLYSPRYKGFALKTADDFKQVFQLGDQSHQLTSQLAADGSFEFQLDGKVVATTLVSSSPLLQFTDVIKVVKPPAKGTGGVIIGPTDRGSARASNVRLSTSGGTTSTTNKLSTSAANRRAAEWVLSVGGGLHFSSANTQGIHNKIDKRDDMPQGAFDVTVIQLGGKQFNDNDLQNLQGLNKLFQLELNSTKIDGTGLGHLIDLPALTSLRISRTSFSDEGISQLAKLSKMTFLDANDVRFSDVALEHLSAHPTLKTMYLAGANATDDCAAYLKRIPNLDNLNFQGAPITDATLVHLSEMQKLTQINLQNTKITDAGLVHMAKIQSLKYLDVRRTKITDAGLMHLVSMPQLNRLMLEGTAVTAVGVKKYQAARKAESLPDVNVTR